MTWKYPDKGELPEDRTYVLCEHSRGTWRDSEDQTGVNFIVLKFVRGRTLEEIECTKPRITGGADEGGNNKRPYEWRQFGPDSFFGQDIIRWMEIPR